VVRGRFSPATNFAAKASPTIHKLPDKDFAKEPVDFKINRLFSFYCNPVDHLDTGACPPKI
jgi:hypothetical protein